MDFTETDVFEALGVDPPDRGTPQEDAPGENPPEGGTPGADSPGAEAPKGEGPKGEGPGAEGTEASAPEAEAPEAEAPEESSPEGGTPGEPPKEDAPEERAPEADAAERQSAIDAAVRRAVQAERERARGEMERFFQRAQLTNTVTGTPIHTMEEFDAWERDFSAEKLRRELREGKLSRETLERAIADNPSVKRAGELVRQREEEQRALAQKQARERMEADLAEIRKLDPAVKSVEDLVKGPGGQRFYEYVRRGNTFLDAWYLANRERMAEQAREQTRQAAETGKRQGEALARSKGHLAGAERSRGAGAARIPADEMDLYRELMPDATDADIQAFYSRYAGKKG